MRKLKGLVISNMYPSEQARTFGIFVKNQVEALRERGIEIDVVSVSNPKAGKKHVLMKYSRWLLDFIMNLPKGKTYDFVHAHYVFPSGLLALLHKRLFKTKMIITAHGGDIDKMAKKNARIRNWTRYILEEADEIIAVGQGLHDEIHESFGIRKDKVSIINMGVNREVFKPQDKKTLRKELRIDEGPVVLFVGNYIQEKGILELIKAFSKVKENHPNAQLHFIGPVKHEGFFNEMILAVDQSDIKDIHIHEQKSQAEVAKWMAASDVFVLPSYIEGFGLVAVEAMACGTPVVGSNVGGLTYLLQQDRGVLVEPKNPHSLFKGIDQVLRDEGLKNRLIQSGLKCAEENDQKVLLDRVIKLYT
ncbi:glycosyltransferase [Bacillus salitolerans]|uniref:Glycosyltransferase n=1 Tax=Bacillus salitolerans TaxID=1437434 RepID=A0ABW4LPA1_9BACI